MVNPTTKTQGGGGDIITREKFGNFELSFDFRYAPEASSGVKYFIDTKMEKDKYSSIGCEYQNLDDKLHPFAIDEISVDRTFAGLYDLIAPGPKKDNCPVKWNTPTIIVEGNHVERLFNGGMTLDYERGNKACKDLVSKSKFKDITGSG